MATTRNIAPVRVREATLHDYAQIRDLQTPYGMQTKTHEEWTHLWAANPVYHQLAKNWPIGWVLENSTRKIVGYIGNVPFSYEFEGKTLLAATTRAWVVDSSYRGYSLLLLDYFFAQKNVDLYLTTTLNLDIFEGFGFFGPSPVPTGDWDHSSFWITNYRGFVDTSLRQKKIPFAKPLSYILWVLPCIEDQFTRARISKYRKHDVRFCSGFDERFDVFWEELKRKRARVLLGTRTREVLDWHFKYALLEGRAWILCVAKGSRLLAYSIFHSSDNPKIGLKRIYLVDFQTLESDEFLLLPMLSHAIKRCRSAGTHILEIVGLSPERAQVISRFAPYRRRLPCWVAFYKANNPQLAESLNDRKRWDLSLFDGDSTL